MPAVTVTGVLTGKGGSQQVSAPCLVGACGLSGATTFAPGYPAAGGDEVKAASIFDGYVGVNLAATLQKRYLSEGQWYTSVPSWWAKLTAAGCRFWLCVKPLRTGVASPSIAASERANLAACVKLLKPYGIVLWNEFDDPDGSGVYWFGGSQPTYAAYVATYGPAAAGTGIPVVICTDVAYAKQGVQQLQQIADPSVFSAALADWYGNHYLKGQYPDKAPEGETASIFGIYDSWGIPPGLGEWGPCEGDVPMSPQDWDNYTGYIYSMMWNRLAAGETIGDICYYSGQTASPGPNNISGPDDFKVPAIQKIATLGRMVPTGG